MNLKTIDKAYVSDIDKALKQFDASHPKSASQLAEIAKNRRIHLKRDHATGSLDEPNLFD